MSHCLQCCVVFVLLPHVSVLLGVAAFITVSVNLLFSDVF